MHSGAMSQRKIVALRTEILPAGSGRDGLFSLSSSGALIWFARLNCRMWIQIQRMVGKISIELHSGAEAMENSV